MAFRIRLNNIDHYQTLPTSLDPPFPPPRGAKYPPKIPIIRIFGTTETGQKVCAHVHGVFPYVYIEYPTAQVGLNPVDRDYWLRALRKSLDRALNTSRGSEFQNPSRKPYVANISLVKGVPFYGFHVGWKYYVKIYLLDPRNMTRLSQVLLSGGILKTVFQPYEAHIQYILQFMIDFNLYGCGFVDCENAKFRQGVPDIEDVGEEHIWHNESIPPKLILSEYEFPRQSYCSLEVDIQTQDIINRREVSARPLHHGFFERTNPIPPDLKLLHSLAELWKDENRRRGSTDQLNMEGFIASSGAREPGAEWMHEEDKRNKVLAMIDAERRKGDGRAPHFENFLRRETFDNLVQTALESVGDFFYSREINPEALDEEDDEDEVEVDENLIGEMNDEDFLGNGDDNELANINKEIFERNEEENEEEEDEEEENKEREEEWGKEPDPVNAKGKGATSEDGRERREESMNDISPPLDEYGPPNFQGGNPDIPTRSNGVCLCHNYEVCVNNEGPISDIHPVAPQKYASGNNKEKLRKNEDGSFEVIKDNPVVLKRKTPPDAPISECRSSKFTKIEAETGKPLNKFSIQSLPSILTTKRKAPESQDDPHPEPSPRSKHVSFSLEFPDMPKSSPPILSPGMLEFPVAKVEILRLSQEHPSQSNSIKSQKTTSVATTELLSSQQRPASQISVISSVGGSTIAEKSNPPNIIAPFEPDQQRNWFVYNSRPPSAPELLASLGEDDIPMVEYQEAFYSNEKDVPKKSREYAGREFRFKSNKASDLPEFDPMGEKVGSKRSNELPNQATPSFKFWEIGARPPSRKEVIKWLEEQKNRDPDLARKLDPGELGQFSQIEGPTQKNKHGFKYSQNKKSRNIEHELQPMSIMSLEIHVNTRGKFVPDPEQDPVVSIFWCLQSNDDLESNGIKEGYHVGILAVDENDRRKAAQNLRRHCQAEVKVEYTELDIITALVDIVRNLDPDILTGYEVHSNSWGYIIERARKIWGMDLCDELSRVRSQGHGRFGPDIDPWGFNTAAAIRITGRHMVNLWRAMRGELNLLGYTMENVVFHLLHRRIPHYSHEALTKWHQSGEPGSLAMVLKYYLQRVQLDLDIIDQQELVSRTSEQARILGVDFNSVFSRGSQFKVESLMFRIAKPENFMLVSPSKRQVGGQNALECLPLVMEPQSDFYTSPVLVLDFQSLYPSIMIAYNYCYSTFLGRVEPWNGQDKMGFQIYKRTPKLLELCKDYINISPNGMMYMKPGIRKSLLAKMLAEILDTRVMVKNGMKRDKDDKQLHKLLNNRQLALKLIANVTYGYTSASFSGRMPCAEIADSIVQTGRETLEKAKVMIEMESRWDAEVVYGDTDSLFVHLKGRTKSQAFDIGEEIAARVTAMNPEPIKLKFEKVYHPCVLLAKKRYVGFKYEHRDQVEPDFDAKGIETVRRDSNPAVQKITEKALKVLFRTSDLSEVKSYVQRQWTKIMKGEVSIQDFTIAKEIKLGSYAEGAAPPPGAKLALARMEKDPRNEPQYGERYPFVVIASGPKARLRDKSVEVEFLLHSSDLSLDSEYYIEKTIIPPLERIFNLVGVNVRQWYNEMPKYQALRKIIKNGGEDKGRKTLEAYLSRSTAICAICNEKAETKNHICHDCTNERDRSVYKLQTHLSKLEKWNIDLQKICWSCSGLPWGAKITCDSQACPIYYSRIRQTSMLAWERENAEPLLKTLENVDEELDW